MIMRKMMYLSVLIVLVLACNAFAETLVLKSGRKIETNYYWIDGNYVKCFHNGGELSFQKSEIDFEATKKLKEEKLKDIERVYSREPKSNPTKTLPQSNNPIARLNKSKVISDIKAELSKKYQGSYSLQKTLLDGHIEAYEYLVQLPATDVNVQILGGLMQKYYPSFSLIKTLYDGNIKAYRELNK